MKKFKYPKDKDAKEEIENKVDKKKSANKKRSKEKKSKKSKKDNQKILEKEEKEEKELTDINTQTPETENNKTKDIQKQENVIETKAINNNKLVNTKIESGKEILNVNNDNDISIIMNNIVLEIDDEKVQEINKKDNIEELEINPTLQKKEKIYNIEVEENIELIKQKEESINKKNNNKKLEVKGLEFKADDPIPNSIIYRGRLFVKDRHQSKVNSDIINYRCKNYRKFENQKNGSFCNALVKRIKINDKIIYDLENNHSKVCNELTINKMKIDSNIISDYKSFIEKCNNYMDNTEIYNKKEFTIALQKIYNDNKYAFLLKPNTIKNIIGKWKSNSLRFTKFNALNNQFNKEGELILWDHTNTIIYLSNKKNPVPSEYYIWSCNSMISRARVSNHFFVDATFHHPKDFSELMIIIFKDIIIHEYIPGFYILLSNKTEMLYDLAFKSVKRILTQNGLYQLNIQTITTDTEAALINAINANFNESQRIGCWFHLKQDLIRNARTMGLLNKRNKDIDINTTFEIITQLTLIPLQYKGNINYVKEKINIMILQYPKYYNLLTNYFLTTKMKYFIDGSYNYDLFPKDIRSNSILERYNKTIKDRLGEKRQCNWVVFLNFINDEIIRITNLLGKNENINILNDMKKTKFGLEKYQLNLNKTSNIINKEEEEKTVERRKLNISEQWLIQKGNNCRYNSFITIFYFTISSFITNIKDKKLIFLNELNELILKLSKEVNEKNYIDIIIFLQKNKFDSNNSLIDQIIKEDDEKKKEILINQMNADTSIDFNSSGYAAQLLSIFKNIDYFCIKESKSTECILCGKKLLEDNLDNKPFIQINNNDMNEKYIYNILLKRYKELYTYDCECRKNSKEDVLCAKIKYNILSYPKILFVLFDMTFSDLTNYKDNIFKLVEEKIILNFNVEYKLSGIISCPSYNHYNSIIFNPIGSNIDQNFTSNCIYYHDGTKNEGRITKLNTNEDWHNIGIPYILVYKFIDI